jgi:hypothetical protein
MKHINIILDYENVAKMHDFWANAEQDIDFRNNKFEAERCTACFAAAELKYHLEKQDRTLKVRIFGTPQAKGIPIILRIAEIDSGGGFKYIPAAPGLTIIGHGRNGLLNGVYEFLRLQGWAWLEPGTRGECVPEGHAIKYPLQETEILPSLNFRGIDLFRESAASEDTVLWMARNCLNVCIRNVLTGKLADKLGMYSRAGGHILHKLLDPDRLLNDGKTIWETHPEWYGTPPDAEKCKKNAMSVQLCVSQKSLSDFISRELLGLLNKKYSDIDILDIWGFDTWGNLCSCSECQKIGNGSNQSLHLLSEIRKNFAGYYAKNLIKRQLKFTIAAYEGTVSLEAPARPISKNIKNSGDICIFYPIKRCYKHFIDDNQCTFNRSYFEKLTEWHKLCPGLNLWIGEYYNVSKYEDMPLVFSRIIPHDMRSYYDSGITGATYMHLPVVNWAMRALTQLQHSRYSWDIRMDDAQFIKHYFTQKYEQYADEVKPAYDLIEAGGVDIAAWRNWGSSMLGDLLEWDGGIPEQPLVFGHFKSSSEISEALMNAVNCYAKASSVMRNLVKREKSENWKEFPAMNRAACNPEQLIGLQGFDTMQYRLEEDLRLLEYGTDMFRLMQAMFKYYYALWEKSWQDAHKYWAELEQCADKMANYYLPISFYPGKPGITSQDALSRSQLRSIIIRCRGKIINGKIPR